MSAESPERPVGSASPLALQITVAHSDFSLEVEDEIALEGVTAIFGPSGSGKSTLLRAIAGFETPRQGRIQFGDSLWFDSDARVNIPPHARPIGMVFQDGRLFEHLDVLGNLRFAESRARPTKLRVVDSTGRPTDRPLALSDVVKALDLETLLKRRVQSLSGGEERRVALARTLLSNPQLLLLDEPLSGLDRDRKREILPYLEDVTRRFRIPTLFVSHAIDEVARLADRVWVFSAGRLVSSGPVSEILESLDLESLTGRFEAGVFVEGRIARHDPRLHLTHVDLHGDVLTMPLVERLAVGDSVRLRIRARDVALATRRPEGLSIRNVIPGRIIELVREADTGSAEVLIELKSDRIRARLTWAAVEELGLEPGDEVFALIKSVSFDSGS